MMYVIITKYGAISGINCFTSKEAAWVTATQIWKLDEYEIVTLYPVDLDIVASWTEDQNNA